MFNFSRMTAVLLLAALLTVVPLGLAQEGGASGVEITSPEAVTELYGDVVITGTAAVPGMSYYYLEIHPLTENLRLDEDTPWLPLTNAIQEPVINGELATIDTNRIGDGVYGLRLTVNTADNQSFHADVGPIRISNERFSELLGTSDTGEDVEQPQVSENAPTPTGVTATSFQPGVTSPNVRYCDIVDNQRCPVIDHLDRNETARVVARSGRTGGWYKIRLNSGHEGWISESVIIIQGDANSLPTETPPDPRPVPPSQPQVSQPSLPPGQAPVESTTAAYPNGISIQGGQAFCNETFNVQINITNPTNVIATGGQISLQDINLRTGEITASGYGSFPNLNPGANFVAVIPLRTSVYYGETHELRARAGGRDVRLQYNLRQGNCNRGNGGDDDDNDDGGSSEPPPLAYECTLTSSTGSFEGYGSPGGGEVVAVIESSQITGTDRAEAAGLTWYQVTYLDTFLWVPVVGYVSTSGRC